jgi:hypothetical protein
VAALLLVEGKVEMLTRKLLETKNKLIRNVCVYAVTSLLISDVHFLLYVVVKSVKCDCDRLGRRRNVSQILFFFKFQVIL